MEKEITFPDKDGRKIVGTLIIPEKDGKMPVVIVCHGFKGDRKQTHIKEVAESISEKGIITLRIDFVNNPGESSVDFSDMTITYELEVLDCAVNYLKTVQEVDTSKIGLTGHSLGGLVVAWYTAEHPEIAAVAPLSAVYSFSQNWERNQKDWIVEVTKNGIAPVWSRTHNQNFQLKKGFYDDGLNYDMDKVIESINCPILIIQATKDSAVTFEAAQHYFDRVTTSNKQLKVIKDSDHNYTQPEWLNEVKTAVAGWFGKVLL